MSLKNPFKQISLTPPGAATARPGVEKKDKGQSNFDDDESASKANTTTPSATDSLFQREV